MGASVTAEETVYTTLDDNLLQVQVGVNVAQPEGAAEGVQTEIHPPVGVSEAGQMWSVGASGGQVAGTSGGLGLILGGDSEGEGAGVEEAERGSKGGLIGRTV